MPIQFFKKYALSLIGAMAILLLMSYIVFLKEYIRAERSEKEQYKQALAFQNARIIKNKSDYDEAIKKLPTVLKMIDTKYVMQYETIYEWRDNNETDDCNDSIQRLNSFKF